MLLLKILIGLNLAYFTLILVLQVMMLTQQEDWKIKEKRLRLSDSKYKTRLEYTGELCHPALSVRNSGSWEDGTRHLLVQVYWIFGKLWLHLKIWPWFAGEWGFGFHTDSRGFFDRLHINYGKKGSGPSRDDRYKIFDMPWAFDWYQTSYLVKEPTRGTLFWLNDTKGSKVRPDRYGPTFAAYKYERVYPYLYILKDGTAQHRYATVTEEKRVWRRKWLPFTNLFALKRHSISIEFDREVGEGKNGWKGGTLGCSWEMQPGETAEQALRRMEALPRKMGR
jgi:hypothetical protein